MGIRVFAGVLSGVLTLPAAALAHDWTVSNGSKYQIHRIFVSPCASHYWGADRLAANGAVAKGQSFVVKDVAAGCYYLKLVDEDGDVCVLRDVRLEANLETALTDKFLTDCQSRG